MANDEKPTERVIPHIDDGYTDGMLGPMYGAQRMSLPAKKLPHRGEPVHRDRFWVGIPWKIILLACAGVVTTLVVFGLLVTLPLIGHHSDPFAGSWHGVHSAGLQLTISKTQTGWDVSLENGRPLHAVERNGQLVASGGGTTLTIRREDGNLIMIRNNAKPVILIRP